MSETSAWKWEDESEGTYVLPHESLYAHEFRGRPAAADSTQALRNYSKTEYCPVPSRVSEPAYIGRLTNRPTILAMYT